MDEPVGGMGGRSKKRQGKGSGEKPDAARGSQLTRKQRKVGPVVQLFKREYFLSIPQRLKAEKELDRDLRETEATESREKKNKLVGERMKLTHSSSIGCGPVFYLCLHLNGVEAPTVAFL